MSLRDVQNDITIELFYIPSLTPEPDYLVAKKLLDEIKTKKELSYTIKSSLTEKEAEILIDEIRMAATKEKFKVVSGGGGALVLSGSKKLNHINGPILVIRENGRIIDVYPRGNQGIKGSRITVEAFLRQQLVSNLPFLKDMQQFAFEEQDLRNLVINLPTLLEEGLQFQDTEVDIGSAVIDLVLIDQDGNHLLLEFKLTAKDSTVGQVHRYLQSEYARKFKIDEKQVRRGIVTLELSGQLIDSCKENQIELFVIEAHNKGFVRKE